MKAFKNYNGPGGGSGAGGSGAGGFHGPGGGSNSGPQNGQGGFNQQSGQGHQQQQGGYQTNPKQLSGGQYHMFTTSLCKRDQKLHKRAVNAVEPAVPRYLRWSEQPIVWSREDHPPRVVNPGHLALVVAPQVGGYKFTKVLMDGGSSINILYHGTTTKLGLEAKDLEPTRTIFHGIVPGLSCSPIGRVRLDVLFGNIDHFRCEPLWFEVVDLTSAYHALLGQPALTKFMAVPHYAYLKMKMPSSKGILTVSGDYRKSSACAAESSRLAESLVIADEKRLLDRVMAMVGKQPELSPDPKESEAKGSFKPAKETKKISLDLEHPERYAVMGTGLDSK